MVRSGNHDLYISVMIYQLSPALYVAFPDEHIRHDSKMWLLCATLLLAASSAKPASSWHILSSRNLATPRRQECRRSCGQRRFIRPPGFLGDGCIVLKQNRKESHDSCLKWYCFIALSSFPAFKSQASCLSHVAL